MFHRPVQVTTPNAIDSTSQNREKRSFEQPITFQMGVRGGDVQTEVGSSRWCVVLGSLISLFLTLSRWCYALFLVSSAYPSWTEGYCPPRSHLFHRDLHAMCDPPASPKPQHRVSEGNGRSPDKPTGTPLRPRLTRGVDASRL